MAAHLQHKQVLLPRYAVIIDGEKVAEKDDVVYAQVSTDIAHLMMIMVATAAVYTLLIGLWLVLPFSAKLVSSAGRILCFLSQC